jgi:hypothetical protein
MTENNFFDLSDFKKYCNKRDWIIDKYTSEFTLQFRLCRYFEYKYNDICIELESNIQKYELSKLTKKEIDIDILYLGVPILTGRKRTLRNFNFYNSLISFNNL